MLSISKCPLSNQGKNIFYVLTSNFNCGYSWSMYYYLIFRDENLGCLWESNNPNVPTKYSITLKTFVNVPEQGRCVIGD